MNPRLKNILIIIILAGLLISGCSAMQTLAPSAQPNTKPLPVEAKTILIGFSIMQIFGHLVRSFFFAAVLVIGLSILIYNRRLQELFQMKKWEKLRTAQEGPSKDLPQLVSRRTWLKFSLAILLAGILIFTLSTLPGMIVTVPPDKIGVLIHLGKEQKTELESGTHLIMPFFEQVALISTREFSYIATSHVEDASEDFTDYKVGARTCDGVAVKLPYTIKFRLIPEMADQVYANYGSISAIQERVVKAESRQIVRQVPTNFSSVAMYTSTAIAMDPALILDDYLRELILNVPCGEATLGFESLNEEIRQMLLDRFIEAGLDLTFFGIRQPDLGAYGEQLDNIRIAAKKAEEVQIGVAEAEALKEQGLINAQMIAQSAKITTVTAAEAEAVATLKKARAEAEARIISADAEAQAVIMAAEAETDANTMVAASLTDDLVEYRLLLALYASWNGKLPTYTGGGAIPLLQLPELQQ